MNKEKLFEKYLIDCELQKQISGQGNPNADILIIGKESTDTSKDLISKTIIRCRDINERDAPRLIEFSNHTWANYQKLINIIYNRESVFSDKWDFEKYAFTTEMNNKPSKRSRLTKDIKEGINQRLEFLKQSEFIQSFPVVILACSNYISNNEEKGYKINETFRVKFDDERNEEGQPVGKHFYNKNYWFYTHHCTDRAKLVIHTIQLSQIKKELFEDMASIICKHLKLTCSNSGK